MAELTNGERAQLAFLLDEAAIRSIVGRYTSAIDWMNWTLLEELFWPDAVIDFGAAFRGYRADFLPYVIPIEEGYTRRLHLFSNPRIAIQGERAEAETASVTHVRSVNGATRADDLVYGRYLMNLEKRAGEWRLSRLYYMLNNFERNETENVEEAPMNLADHTSMKHPQAPRFG